MLSSYILDSDTEKKFLSLELLLFNRALASHVAKVANHSLLINKTYLKLYDKRIKRKQSRCLLPLFTLS